MATDYAGFIATVEREADVPHDQAERAVTATLETLGERISVGEAHDLAGQLPPELQPLVDQHAGDGPRPLSAEEFLQRVQVREHVPIMQVRDHVRAVFVALRETVEPKEVADLASELPRELEMLLFDDLPLEDLGEGLAGSSPSSIAPWMRRPTFAMASPRRRASVACTRSAAAEQLVAAITTMQPLGWQGSVSSLAASTSQRSIAPRAVGSSRSARSLMLP